jgi:hypothetical protein
MASKSKGKGVGLGLYLKAFVISILLFTFGLVIGILIENFLVTNLSSRTSAIENSVGEIELEMLYAQNLPTNESCVFLSSIVRKTNENLDLLAQDLMKYSDKNVLFTSGDVNSIKTTYTSLLIKDWILQERIKEGCGTDTMTVLYFYTSEGCDDCITQGNVLTILKDEFKDKLMVFPIDTRIDLSMIDILKERFSVTSMPGIVINGKTYSRIMSLHELKILICSEMPQAEACSS